MSEHTHEVITPCPEVGCTYAGTDEQLVVHKTLMDKHDLHARQISDDPQPFCIGCHKIPEEIDEYSKVFTKSRHSPSEYVKREEGTYNRTNGHFLCTHDYLRAGAPSSPNGWKAP